MSRVPKKRLERTTADEEEMDRDAAIGTDDEPEADTPAAPTQEK